MTVLSHNGLPSALSKIQGFADGRLHLSVQGPP